MAKNRVLFFLWLLLWAAVWLRGGGNFAGFLLLATLLAAAAEIAVAARVRRQITAEISAPLSCKKNESLPVTLTVQNTGLLSCAALSVRLCCRNRLTGEEEVQTLCLSVGGKSSRQAQAFFVPRRCGKLALIGSDLRVLDLFGLRGFSVPADCSAAALVMPEIVPVELSLTEHLAPDADSEEYSKLHPGSDPGETFALREYVPGDAVKNIHWKLSEKTGALWVRQLGLPVEDSLLVVMDNSAETLPDVAEREALGEATASVCAALCGEGIGCRLAWVDYAADALTFREISDTGDLTAALPELLSAEMRCGELPAADRAAAAVPAGAHLAVITLRQEAAPRENCTVLRVSAPLLSGEEGLYLAI